MDGSVLLVNHHEGGRIIRKDIVDLVRDLSLLESREQLERTPCGRDAHRA